MLIDHIARLIKEKLNETPTNDQEKLIASLSGFILDRNQNPVLVVKGYAGTGKTSTISAYVEALDSIKQKYVLLAPTGRAAKVLSSYSGKNAYTIHKKIYRQKSSKDGFGSFDLDVNLHTNTIFIVDEASMISNEFQSNSIFGTGNVLNDLIEYVFNDKGCKLILIGDVAQLPPVGLNDSPGLDMSTLSGYSNHVAENNLTEVVRQVKDSGILCNATLLRNHIDNNKFGGKLFELKNYSDIIQLNGSDLVEELNQCYDKYGIKDTIVVNRSNKRANKYNQGIRASILFRENELEAGDMLMVVKNNYYWGKEYEGLEFIANGDIVEVIRIHNYHSLYGYRFADCTLKMNDYGIEIRALIMLDVLHEEAPALPGNKNKELFFSIIEDYEEIKSKKKKFEKVKSNKFFNALQVKYAYAITCHKSQGGQWKSVFIDQGYITEEMVNKEYLRWLYTALTRATEKVYLVNPPKFMV